MAPHHRFMHGKVAMNGDLMGKFQGFTRQVFCISCGEKHKVLGRAPIGFKIWGVVCVSHFGLETEVIPYPVAGILWICRGCFLQAVWISALKIRW